jgi:hypothetical protein
MSYKYKVKKCIRCRKEFIPTGGGQKYCKDCKSIVKKERNKQWEEIHPDKIKESKRQWIKAHPEYMKQYYLDYSEQIRQHTKQYRKEHPNNDKEWKARNPERIKELKKKYEAKRRSLGFNPVNKSFEGSNGHHLNDKRTVIYIPKSLHKSIYHNHNTGQGMIEMDTLAVQYWITQVMKHGHKEVS